MAAVTITAMCMQHGIAQGARARFRAAAGVGDHAAIRSGSVNGGSVNGGSVKDGSVNDGSIRVEQEISYGSGLLNKLDIYAPTNRGTGLPLLMFVHGGGWQRGDKHPYGSKSGVFNDNGIIYVNVNYGLAPSVMHPQQIRDIAAAFAWCHNHAAEYGGDPRRIYLMGHSAGAQLVDLLGTNDKYVTERGLGLKDIRGVISLDGASLNLLHKTDGHAPEDRFVGPMIKSAFGTDTASLTDGSPSLNIHNGKQYPPFLMFCGERRTACVAEHQNFANLMKQAGGKAVVRPVPLSHSEINAASSQPESSVCQEIMAFVKK